MANLLLEQAAHQTAAATPRGMLERLFTLMFQGFVYNQIWEDPSVDLDALKLQPHHKIVTIASGGCNVLNYLTAAPAKIIALDRELLQRVIVTSCSIKARIVETDEREENQRAVLNFGHTIGHALEAATDYREFLHGEAVGIGMVKAVMLSVQHGFCDQQTFERILKVIKKAGLPSEIPARLSMQSVVEAMQLDKKAAGGRIKFVMSEGIGKTRFHWLSPGEVLSALER